MVFQNAPVLCNKTPHHYRGSIRSRRCKAQYDKRKYFSPYVPLPYTSSPIGYAQTCRGPSTLLFALLRLFVTHRCALHLIPSLSLISSLGTAFCGQVAFTGQILCTVNKRPFILISSHYRSAQTQIGVENWFHL